MVIYTEITNQFQRVCEKNGPKSLFLAMIYNRIRARKVGLKYKKSPSSNIIDKNLGFDTKKATEAFK